MFGRVTSIARLKTKWWLTEYEGQRNNSLPQRKNETSYAYLMFTDIYYDGWSRLC